jgi:hypothetical protein
MDEIQANGNIEKMQRNAYGKGDCCLVGVVSGGWRERSL